MKSTGILIACGALVLTGSMGAQSQPPADPVSGTWTGHMEASSGQRQYVTVTLKLDGKSLTGTITGPPSPGEIRGGAFDPSTGALRLDVVVQDAAKSAAVFDGKIVGSVATGQVSIHNQQAGSFSLTRDASGAAASAAPPGRGVETMEALRRHFAEVSDHVTKSADLVPADKYSYRPTDSVRTFGQMVGHIADGYSYYCATASGRKVQWSDAIEKGTTEKAALVQKLREATEACRSAHAEGAQVGPLVGNIGHANLHYGNLITYMRMLGLVPPSS